MNPFLLSLLTLKIFVLFFLGTLEMISPSSAYCYTSHGLSDVLLGVPFAFLLLLSDPLYFSPVLARTSSSQQLHVPLAIQGKKQALFNQIETSNLWVKSFVFFPNLA